MSFCRSYWKPFSGLREFYRATHGFVKRIFLALRPGLWKSVAAIPQDILMQNHTILLRVLKKTGQYFVLSALCLTLAFGPLTSQATAQIFSDFGLSEEKEMGRQFAVLIKSRMPIIEDPEVKEYVRHLLERLVTSIPPQPFEFEVNVILDDSINAFAVPGGFLFVNTGLILAMENESEVVGVMGHELAHATQRHMASRIEKMKIFSMLSLLGALGGMFMGNSRNGGGALMAGSLAMGQTAMLNYSRIDENEADQVGMNYVVAAGYKPSGIVGAFETIRKAYWANSAEIPTYLSTHPDIQSRIKELGHRISLLPPAVRNRKDDNTTFYRVQSLLRGRYADPTQALRFFEKNTTIPKALNAMAKGMVFARVNRVKDARAAFEEAVKLAPHDPLIKREAAIFNYQKGDHDVALKLLEQVSRQTPSDYYARFFLALCYLEDKKPDLAFKLFDDVLRYVPEDSEVYSYYGRALGEQGQYFKGYLYLAYSALYANNEKRVNFWLDKAKKLASSPADTRALETFNQKLKERSAFW